MASSRPTIPRSISPPRKLWAEPRPRGPDEPAKSPLTTMTSRTVAARRRKGRAASAAAGVTRTRTMTRPLTRTTTTMTDLRRDERGIALLLTILVVALVAVAVVEFTYSSEVDAHVTRNALNAMQAHYLARSGAALGQVALRVDAEQKALTAGQSPAVETLTDPWARPFPPLAIDGGFGFASFTISDETS